eukprot:1184548-Prorocentrum_minimum.AAC.6
MDTHAVSITAHLTESAVGVVHCIKDVASTALLEPHLLAQRLAGGLACETIDHLYIAKHLSIVSFHDPS